jgi:hypothetical protein
LSTAVKAGRPAYSPRTLNIVTASIMVVFHVLAVTALFFFSWTNLLVAFVLHWLAVGFGISLGYHRLHTHRGYKTSKAFEYFLAVCGTMTLEGGPIFWVATHRVHHQHSDKDGDPHTPHDGGFWAHVGWILFGDTHHNNTELMSKYAPDLGADPFYRWLNSYHYVPLTSSASRSSRLAAGRWCCGGSSSGSLLACTVRGSSIPRPTCGVAGDSRLATTRATAGGWRFSPLARAGTTITTLTPSPRATALRGMNSTSAGSRSRRSTPSALCAT